MHVTNAKQPLISKTDIKQQVIEIYLNNYKRLPLLMNSKHTYLRLLEYFSHSIEKAQKNGLFEVFRYHGKVRSFLLIYHEPRIWWGGSGYIGLAGHELNHDKSYQWLKKALPAVIPNFTDHFEINLGCIYKDLCKFIIDQQLLKLSLVTFIGEPKTALTELQKQTRVPKDLKHLGLSIKKLTQKEEVDQIITLQENYFSQNPRYGFFCANPQYLDLRRKHLTKQLNRGQSYYVIYDRSQLLGYFSSEMQLKHGIWHKKAGIEFIVSPVLHGLGILKTAYYILLKDMVADDVQMFIGGTSQPSVLHYSKILKRIPLNFHLDRNGFFDYQYFEPYL